MLLLNVLIKFIIVLYAMDVNFLVSSFHSVQPHSLSFMTFYIALLKTTDHKVLFE